MKTLIHNLQDNITVFINKFLEQKTIISEPISLQKKHRIPSVSQISEQNKTENKLSPYIHPSTFWLR